MCIILASQSPRRRALLASVGLDVEVQPSDIDETARPGESALAMTVRLCQAKAAACIHDDKVVIAADTLVEIDRQALGQPEDIAHAKRMIRMLSGKTHGVHTTVCVRLADTYALETVTTFVSFREITEDEIDVYVQHNEILDKAGAYAIQGGASGFITGIEGSLDNVIGLPVRTTLSLIAKVQYEVETI